MHLPVWNWHRGVNVTLSKLPSRHPKPACETARVDVSTHFFSACVSLLIFWGGVSLPLCLFQRCKPYSPGCINVANFVVAFVTISKMCLAEPKGFAPAYTSSSMNKAFSGILCHYTASIWHEFTPLTLGKKGGKNNWSHYLSSLWQIRFIIFTTTASMSPVTWEAAPCRHRLTVAPCKALVFDVTTMPHQPLVLGIEHGRLSRGCLSAKWLLAHLLSGRVGGGGGARAVGGEIGRRRMVRIGAKRMKSRKIRMTREGWGSKERGKESGSAGSLPLLAPLAGSCCWWLQKSARQSRSLLLAIRDHSSGCLLASLQIPQKYPLITTVGHRLFTKWI